MNPLGELTRTFASLSLEREHLLSELVSKYPHRAESLSNVWNLLSGFNDIAYRGNEQFYLALEENALLCTELLKVKISVVSAIAELWQRLQGIGIVYQENKQFCERLIADLAHLEMYVLAFEEMDQEGIAFHGNERLYNALIDNSDEGYRLMAAFTHLHIYGVIYQGHEILYEAIIAKQRDFADFVHAVGKLFLYGIKYCGNELLYESVIASENPLNYVQVFIIFNKANVTFDINNSRQLATVYTKKLQSCLDSFERVGITPLTHAKCYNVTSFTEKIDLLEYIFSLGSFHPSIFVALVEKVADDVDDYTVSSLVKRLEIYASTNSPADLSAEEAKKILEFSPLDSLAFGPLKKSKVTIAVEELLTKISTTPIENILVTYEFECYFIQIYNRKINLSLLIKNSNLSQLVLNATTLQLLCSVIKNIIPADDWNDVYVTTPIVAMLPYEQQVVLNLYSAWNHIDINKLLRWEKLAEIHPLHPDVSKNMLVHFLLGCVVNDAINKLSHLPYQKRKPLDLLLGARVGESVDLENEREYTQLIQGSCEEEQLRKFFKEIPFFYPKATVLDRGEERTPVNINSRIANRFWTLPAITSTSARPGGLARYHKGDAIRTTWFKAHHFIYDPEIEEVLFAQGEQVMSYLKDGKLITTIIRSPTLDRNRYLSDRALFCAFTHLKKKYSEEASSITIDGIKIFRPNHGLAHAYRVMLCIDQVIKYFSYFAADPDFKGYCISLSSDDEYKELLRTAVAFGSTGRESEIAAIEDLDRYTSYRNKSAAHLVAFMQECGEPIEPQMKYRLEHIIRFMGNPKFASDLRNEIYIHDHRILTFAHKLDLLRCYPVEEYEESVVGPINGLSSESFEQKKALDGVIQYNAALLKAHGNGQVCDINRFGHLIKVDILYSNPFKEVSLSLKQVIEISEGVPKPY